MSVVRRGLSWSKVSQMDLGSLYQVLGWVEVGSSTCKGLKELLFIKNSMAGKSFVGEAHLVVLRGYIPGYIIRSHP